MLNNLFPKLHAIIDSSVSLDRQYVMCRKQEGGRISGAMGSKTPAEGVIGRGIVHRAAETAWQNCTV